MSDNNMLSEAHRLTELGFIVHPLTGPNAGGNSPGKRPIKKDWQKQITPYNEKIMAGWWGPDATTQYNMGLVCGRASGVMVVDMDSMLFIDDLFDGIEINTLRSARIKARGHVYFKYDPGIRSQKHHELGIEILSDGSNAVLPPSCHISGDVYHWADPNDPIQEIPNELKKRLLALFELTKRVTGLIRKCRPCFNRVWKEHDDLHGSDGREMMLSFCTELKANGATLEDIRFVAKIVYQDEYDQDRTDTEFRNSDTSKPWKCATIQDKLSGFVSDEQCDRCGMGRARHEPGYNGKATDDTTADNKREEETTITESIPEVKAIAKEIMKSGDPIQMILDTHQTIHRGDADTALTLLLSLGAQSGLNTGGIQPKVSGQTAKGKTHCVRAMAHMVPKTWMLETNVSDKAMYYMEMPDSAVIFCDDVVLSETLESILKRTTSNFQKGDTWTTLNKNREPEVHTIPPRITFWLTSVDDNDQLQLLNRQFGGSVDESSEQDDEVCRFQLEQAASGAIEYPENAEVMICREIIRDLKKSAHIVDIPYASNIIWNDKVNRRNNTIFLDMVRAFALLRKHQRPVSNDGHVVALIDDYEDAKTLYGGRAELQGTKLTQKEKECVDILRKAGTIEAAELQMWLKVSAGRLSQLMNGTKNKEESGLMYKVPELHKEKESVRTNRYNEGQSGEDGKNELVTVTKTYYSLNGGTPNEAYNNIVFLKTGTESVLNRALPVLYPCFTRALGNENNNIIKNSIHYNGLLDKCALGILNKHSESDFTSIYNLECCENSSDSLTLTEKHTKTSSALSDNDNGAKAHLKHTKAHPPTLKHTIPNLDRSEDSQFDFGQKTMELLDDWYGNKRPEYPSECKTSVVPELVRITGMSHEAALRHVTDAFKALGWA